MKEAEKSMLLELLDQKNRWCQEVEARDAAGSPVHYNDTSAVAWDLVGAFCKLFGWVRACKLFIQVTELAPHQRFWADDQRAIAAMVALQEFNDAADMTHEMMMTWVRSVRVRD